MGDHDSKLADGGRLNSGRKQASNGAGRRPEPPKSAKWLQQRERILAVAGRLFWQKGYSETSMKDIGKAANLNSATIFYYFKSKALILFEISTGAAQGLLDLLEPIDKSDLPPGRKLDEAVGTLVRWAITNVGLTGIGQMERRNLPPRLRERYTKQRDEVDAIFRRLLGQVFAHGQSKCQDPKVASLFVLGLANSIVQWYRPGGERQSEEIVSMARTFVAEALNLSYFEHSRAIENRPVASAAPAGE